MSNRFWLETWGEMSEPQTQFSGPFDSYDDAEEEGNNFVQNDISTRSAYVLSDQEYGQRLCDVLNDDGDFEIQGDYYEH